MVFGIAGGLLMCGLIMGAISGSVVLMIIPTIAGLLIAGIWDGIKKAQDRTAASWALKQYPPYGY